MRRMNSFYFKGIPVLCFKPLLSYAKIFNLKEWLHTFYKCLGSGIWQTNMIWGNSEKQMHIFVIFHVFRFLLRVLIPLKDRTSLYPGNADISPGCYAYLCLPVIFFTIYSIILLIDGTFWCFVPWVFPLFKQNKNHLATFLSFNWFKTCSASHLCQAFCMTVKKHSFHWGGKMLPNCF